MVTPLRRLPFIFLSSRFSNSGTLITISFFFHLDSSHLFQINNRRGSHLLNSYLSAATNFFSTTFVAPTSLRDIYLTSFTVAAHTSYKAKTYEAGWGPNHFSLHVRHDYLFFSYLFGFQIRVSYRQVWLFGLKDLLDLHISSLVRVQILVCMKNQRFQLDQKHIFQMSSRDGLETSLDE